MDKVYKVVRNKNYRTDYLYYGNSLIKALFYFLKTKTKGFDRVDFTKFY